MVACSFLRSRLRGRNPLQGLNRTLWRLVSLPLPLLLAVLIVITTVAVVVVLPSRIEPPAKTPVLKLPEIPEINNNKTTETLVTKTHHENPSAEIYQTTPLAAAQPPPRIEQLAKTPIFQLSENPEINNNKSIFFQFPVPNKAKETLITKTHENPSVEINQTTPLEAAPPPPPPQTDLYSGGPYHDWEIFAADYKEMLQNLKIYVYNDAFVNSKYSNIFHPHPNPSHPKLGNYFSEHAFKVALVQSSLLTPHPEEAHFFYMPFSINAMRNDPRLHSAKSISDFVSKYATKISSEFPFWNSSGGADHFYVYCHSIGRDAASKHIGLHNTAIQVTCSSSYFQKLYTSHKDFGLPQVWPRRQEKLLNPPDSRKRLVFFAGRIQNSRIRQDLLDFWGNDSSMDVFSETPPSLSYEEGFRRSRFCLHVKGYEVNTARVSDAIQFGCVPVLISNHYDLPFANVLDWGKFSIIIDPGDIGFLKKILMSVSREMYLNMYKNLGMVRRHFEWNTYPRDYDSFYMTAYQLWLRRGLHRIS